MIPVVYSSFTTFYNPKKNLFTSGIKEPEGLYSHLETGLMPYPCGDLVHKDVGGKQSRGEQESSLWDMCGVSSKHLAAEPGLG